MQTDSSSPVDPYRIALDGVPSGEEVIRRIASETDTVLMAFSCGKDSTAAWLAIRPHFKRVVPFFMYLVPDLEFVEKSVRYYEEFFGCRIARVPHPSLYRMLRNLTYQPPERCRIIEAAGLANFDYEDVRDWLCDDFDLPSDTWYASGVRAADSPNRRTAMKTHGPIGERKRVFYPVWDLRKDGLVEMFRTAKVKLPEDYKIFGRSFDGVDYRFLEPIRRHYPDDYRKIIDLFPLAELELFRASCAQGN